jgi:hypothetical protein
MLLRGKYDALINITWDCFDQSNFYISRINIIEWNNMICLIDLIIRFCSENKLTSTEYANISCIYFLEESICEKKNQFAYI